MRIWREMYGVIDELHDSQRAGVIEDGSQVVVVIGGREDGHGSVHHNILCDSILNPNDERVVSAKKLTIANHYEATTR